MSRIVISGVCDSPHWAKVEMLSDYMEKNIDNFYVDKLIKTSQEWDSWYMKMCKDNNWSLKNRKVLVWRELVSRGGKPFLIGDYNDYQEYIYIYYMQHLPISSKDLLEIAQYNKDTKMKSDLADIEKESKKDITRVAISATGNAVCASLVLTNLANFFPREHAEKSFSLHLYNEIDSLHDQALKGYTDGKDEKLSKVDGSDSNDPLAVQLIDMTIANVVDVHSTSNFASCIKDARVLLILDKMDKKQLETKRQYLKRVFIHFQHISNWICKLAHRDCLIMVSNLGPYHVISKSITDTFSTLNQNWRNSNILLCDQTRIMMMKSILSKKILNFSKNIHDIIDWNCTGVEITADEMFSFIDFVHGKVYQQLGPVEGKDSFSVHLIETINDKRWLEGEFVQQAIELLKRTREIDDKSFNQAYVMTKTFIEWYGVNKGAKSIVTLTCPSQGWYQVEKNLPFSFPAIIGPCGRIQIIENLAINETVHSRIVEMKNLIVEDLELLQPNIDDLKCGK